MNNRAFRNPFLSSLPNLLLSLFIFYTALLAGCAPDKEPGQPNIIVIITDDHRHDFLGSVSPQFMETPNLDRLAAEGVRYSNAFVTTSLCSPARATYLTGVHAHTHKVVINEEMDITEATPNVAQMLQKEGYETAFIGKWHQARWATPRPGFDHWVGFQRQGHYYVNTLNVDGQWELCKNYITDELTQRAIDYLKRPKDKPFLMFLSHKAVHGPFNPAPGDTLLFDNLPVPSFNSPQGDIAHKSPWKENRRVGETELIIQRYRQTLASVDDGVGQLLAALEEQGTLDNTAIIYVGDNGYMMGEHGGLWDKRAAFEPSIRVPMLMRYPAKIKGGRVDDKMVLNLDLVPTLLELAGAKAKNDLSGVSWLDDGPRRQSFLYEYFAHEGSVPTTLAVRTEDWKLVTYPRNPELTNELFNLVEDPHETTNQLESRSDVVQELQVELNRLMSETGFQWPGYLR